MEHADPAHGDSRKDEDNAGTTVKLCSAEPLFLIPMGPLPPPKTGCQVLITFSMHVYATMFDQKKLFVPAVSVPRLAAVAL